MSEVPYKSRDTDNQSYTKRTGLKQPRNWRNTIRRKKVYEVSPHGVEFERYAQDYELPLPGFVRKAMGVRFKKTRGKLTRKGKKGTRRR